MPRPARSAVLSLWSHRFEREIEVGVPDPAAREDILNVRCGQVCFGSSG